MGSIFCLGNSGKRGSVSENFHHRYLVPAIFDSLSVHFDSGMSFATSDRQTGIQPATKGNMMLTVARTTVLATTGLMLVVTASIWQSNSAWAGRQDVDVPQSDQQKKDQAALFMQAKLSNAQLVLQGLVSEDFQAIASGARQMKKIAQAAHWPTTIDEVYQHHSFEFRRQCDKLIKLADEQNLRAAHYTYLHMSTTCIDCHDYVRPRFRVERQPQGPVRLIPTEWDGPTKKFPKPSPDEDDDKDA